MSLEGMLSCIIWPHSINTGLLATDSTSLLQVDIYPFLEGGFVETPTIHSMVELFHHRYLLYDLEVIHINVHFFGLKGHLSLTSISVHAEHAESIQKSPKPRIKARTFTE